MDLMFGVVGIEHWMSVASAEGRTASFSVLMVFLSDAVFP
jgi:hypothetical protein